MSLQKGLVGHWTMDDRDFDNGVIRDRSAYNNKAIVDGSINIESTSSINGAAAVSSADKLDIPGPILFTAQDTFSMSCWFKCTEVGNGDNMSVFTKGGYVDAYGIDYSPSSEAARCGLITDSDIAITSSTAELDQYHHVVLVHDSTNFTANLYLNGELKSSIDTSNVPPLTDDGEDYLIGSGRVLGGSSQGFIGSISDARIYNRALSDSEINALYQQRNTRETTSRGFPVAAGNLVARYPFRDGSARDDARNENYGEPTAYDGTVGGATYDSKGGPKVDGSFNFDGDNDYIAIDGFTYQGPDVGDITVVSWFKTTASSQSIIASYDRSEYWRLEIGSNAASDGSVGMSFRTDSGTTDGFGSTTRVDDDNWHHVVFTYSSGSAKLYLDGTEENSGSYGNYIGDDSTTRYGFIGVGSEANSFNGSVGPSDYFDGVIDDFRIYNAQLTDTDVKQIYQNTRPQISASGGTTVTTERINGEQYRIHAFEDVGTSTFEVSDAQANATADVLVVAGGGGGGGDGGGGGGAGGIVFKSGTSVSSGSYSITVGDGGEGNEGSTSVDPANDGDDSTAFGLTAIGGGAGGNYNGNPPRDGGSGGGGDRDTTGASALQPGSTDGGFGNSGGDGESSTGGAGGGGAAEIGQDASNGGNGGDGKDYSDIFTKQFGENGYFGGGGAGGNENAGSTLGDGGLGGGGDSNGDGNSSPSDEGLRGVDGTGGGGAGATGRGSAFGGNGGSGIVLIRYKL